MTSYVLVLCKDNKVRPIKFGGLTSDEPKLRSGMSEKKILEVSARDVKTSHKAWIPKKFVNKIQFFKSKETGEKYIKVKSSDGSLEKIPIDCVLKWSRGSKMIDLEGSPFNRFTMREVKKMVKEGISVKSGKSRPRYERMSSELKKKA
jgi:hypothetical protein